MPISGYFLDLSGRSSSRLLLAASTSSGEMIEKDNNEAYVIGTKTYGKGIGQVVPLTAGAEMNSAADSQLKAALSHLKQSTAPKTHHAVD